MTDSAGKRFTCYTFNDTTPASQELQPLQVRKQTLHWQSIISEALNASLVFLMY